MSLIRTAIGVNGMLLGQAPILDNSTLVLLAAILALLGITYLVGQYLQGQPEATVNKGIVQALNNRVRAWWMMYAVMGATLFFDSHRILAVLFFFLISFWALREFITLTPTRLGDHRALFWGFFIFTPLQYLLVWLGRDTYTCLGITFDAGVLFSNLIPVYAMLFIPARVAFAGDHRRFLERTAKIQAGLYLCVFALSHAPALLDLTFVDSDGKPWSGGSAGVLLFFILVVQMGDIFQFLWHQFLGKTVIAPAISPNKTWEGFIGGALSATLIAMGLWWVTPFTPLQAASLGLLLGVMGFSGGMAMSAIKRDRGVQDYGTLVEGHVGVLDQFDSICFAAPIFYHVARFFFT